MTSRTCIWRGFAPVLAVFAASIAVAARAAVYTVPSGDTLVVTDANVADYSGGITFADSTGVVEFNTSSAPTMDITGNGTVKKTSSSAWTMSKAISNFKGNYELGGNSVVSVGIRYAFGHDSDTKGPYSVTVLDGSTLVISASDGGTLNYRMLVLNGKGVNGRGAVEVAASSSGVDAMRSIRLDSDTRIGFLNNKYIFVAITGKGIDLNGHVLELTGNGQLYPQGKLTGEGEIVMRGNGTSARTQFIPRDQYFAADPSDDDPVVMQNYATLNFYKPTRPFCRPVWITGADNIIYHSEQFPNNFPNYDWSTNIATICGAVTFTNETGMSKVSIYTSFPRREMSITGPITGRGTVTVSSSNNGRVRLYNGGNTFSGGLFVNGQSGGQFMADKPGSIGAYSAVTGSYGHVDCLAASDSNPGGWTIAKFAEFASAATWQNGAFPLLDLSGASGRQEIDASTLSTVSSWGVAGEVDVANSTSLPANFILGAGTANITSGSPIALSGKGVSGATVCTNAFPGRLVLDGGVRATIGSLPFRAGGYASTTGANAPRLVVKNATIVNENTSTTSWTAATDDALAVGCSDSGPYCGVLELHDGAVVTNKLLAGGWEGTISNSKSHGYGGVHQYGGEMAALGTLANHQYGGGLGMDAKSYGGYEMHGGKFFAFGVFYVGGYGTGAWSQYGGVAIFTNSLQEATRCGHPIGGANNGFGVMSVRGGVVRSCGGVNVNANGHPSVRGGGHLAVDGKGAMYDAYDATITLNSSGGGAYRGMAWVEANNGGTIRARGIYAAANTVRGSYFGFGGGTLKASVNNLDLFNGTNGPSRITVYAGGACIDTDGRTGSKIAANLEGPQGGGVASIPLSAPLSFAGLVASPYVEILGDGVGASAVAEYDPASGTVTNLHVTAPGVDYTAATARVFIASSSILTNIVCTVAPNVNTGSFTKAGAGDLTLSGTNTWGGATVLEGGTLILGSDRALPSGTTLVFAGGAIDLGGNAAPTSYAVEVGESAVTYPGAYEFPAGSTLEVRGDLEAFAEGRNRAIVTFTGGVSGPLPTMSGADEKQWKLRMRGNSIRLVPLTKGMTIVFK